MNCLRALLASATLAGCAGTSGELEIPDAPLTARDDEASIASEQASDTELPAPSGATGGSLDTDTGRPPGGACEYVTTEGTAVIDRIETPAANIYQCTKDPVVVHFQFEPDDADANEGRSALRAREGQLTVGAGAAPPRACITAAGIEVGSRLPVQRLTIVRGTCSPVVFQFDEALIDACIAECW